MRALILVVLSISASAYCDSEVTTSYYSPEADPLCASVPPGGILLFPYPGNCSRFYECINGTQTEQNCPDDLWFNQILQACDFPDDSGCRNLVCPPSGVVDFYPVAGNCTSYIECYQGNATVFSCPPPLWFNSIEKRCTAPDLSQCGIYAPTVPPTWSTPTDNCWGVLPDQVLLRPYPGDCTMYIECVGSNEAELPCPPGLYFDYDRQMCNIRDLVNCSGGPTPPPWTTPDGDSDDDPRCADGNDDYWPDPDCSKFVECWRGHGYRLDCPSGLYFDPIARACENPNLAQCGRTTPETSTRDGDWTPDPFCPWPSYDRYLYPYPGDCSRYIVCYWGERIVEECPPGLWFNPYLLVCDYPYHSGCIL